MTIKKKIHEIRKTPTIIEEKLFEDYKKWKLMFTNVLTHTKCVI